MKQRLKERAPRENTGSPTAASPPETPTIGIIHINAEQRISYIHPDVARILNLDSQLVQAQLGAPVIQIPLQPDLSPMLQRILAGETLSGEQTQWRHLSAQPILLEIHSTPLREPSGAWIGAVIILQNITAREQTARVQQQLLTALEQRSMQMETAAQVSRATSSILNLDQLIHETVHLVRERFGMHYVGLFEIDASGQRAVLRAGTGAAGQQLLAQGYQLPLDDSSMTGWCIIHQQPRIAANVATDETHLENPLLPETRSELTLPLISRHAALGANAVLGALTIQSAHEDAFNANTIIALQTMADQLANAMANARLYEQAQREIAERIRAESQLSASKSQLEHLLSISPAVIYTSTTTAPNTLTFISDNVVNLLGCQAADLLESQNALLTRVHPEDLAILNTAHATLLQNGDTSVEYRLQTAGGEYRWINDRKRLVEALPPHPQGIVGCWIDITESKLAENAIKRLNRELVLLYRASRALAASLDLSEVLTTVTEEMQRLLGVSACSVWLKDDHTEDLVCNYASGPASGPLRGLRVVPGQGLVSWVFETGKNALVNDMRNDPRHAQNIAHMTQFTPRSALCVPLRSTKGNIGVLEIVDTTPDRFIESDLDLLGSLAALAAIAIENARLYEQARLDMHTKSILLDEINHRVKNNLTAIMGILSLEMNRAFEGPQDYHTTLCDIQNRIQSITTVHNLLSDTQWNPLPIARLAEEIIHVILSASPLRQNIKVQVHSETIPPGASAPLILPRQATGLAIIINELTTNSLKHAFNTRQQGHILFHIRSEEISGRLHTRLEFRDDGPGWPSDVLNGTRSNIGLRLIRMTVISPLRGQLELYNDQGAVAAITFEPQP
ncbi:MAG: GAF domain-containing protein [Anaerolineae bacterium]|nr:GAF domain-containing protein [Anaerolineae bacterium]